MRGLMGRGFWLAMSTQKERSLIFSGSLFRIRFSSSGASMSVLPFSKYRMESVTS
jgi:hypothetical protein